MNLSSPTTVTRTSTIDNVAAAICVQSLSLDATTSNDNAAATATINIILAAKPLSALPSILTVDRVFKNFPIPIRTSSITAIIAPADAITFPLDCCAKKYKATATAASIVINSIRAAILPPLVNDFVPILLNVLPKIANVIPKDINTPAIQDAAVISIFWFLV